MFKKYFTLIVVPEATSQFRQIRIPHALVYGIVFLLAVLIIGVPTTSYLLVKHYHHMKQVATGLPSIRKETADQKFLLEQYERDISELHQVVSRLKRDNAKLMNMAGVEHVPEAPIIFTGMGGGEEHEIGSILEKFRLESEEAMLEKIEGLSKLKTYALDQEELSHRLMEFFEDQKTLLAATPSIWPVKGWLTSNFGYRKSPFTGKRTLHSGIDIANKTGTQIVSSADGIVSFSGTKGGFGKVLVIDHGYGYSTFYGHCSKLEKKVGEQIKRGDVVALLGNTGNSTGPHVHYEVRVNGVATDPMKYILDN
jgi:murein DD-endopeptidase MepM/ murein hydrolase activator NlpD